MSHRKATLKNLAIALFENSAITTTVAKSKELRIFAEPIITLAKQDSVHHRRLAFAKLRHKGIVTKLFTEIGPAFADRPGGYTRILRVGNRPGDAAEMARIELVGLGEYKVDEED
jgi:large subunit ribosomal protein L17